MGRQWSREEAWDWYRARPYVNGCNFAPANVSMQQFYSPKTHEAAFPLMEKEVRLAASVGLNSFRLRLPPRECWREDPARTVAYFEEFIALCDDCGISLMPRFFSDCAAVYPPDANGRRVTCFDGTRAVGTLPEDDPANWPEAERYVLDFVLPHRDDRRVLMWNIWNEAGNANRQTRSLPFITRLFELLRAHDVSQPLTADCYGLYRQVEGRYSFELGLEPVERAVCGLSDIITFHYYGDLLHTKKYFLYLAEQFGRPMLNTEWGHRPWGSFIPSHLPLFKKYNVGSYFFGLVIGPYARYDRVWPFIADDKSIDTSLWMHGVFHSDFTPYDPDDIDALMAMKAVLEREREDGAHRKEQTP